MKVHEVKMMVNLDILCQRIKNPELFAFSIKMSEKETRIVYVDPVREEDKFALEEILTNIIKKEPRWLVLNKVFMINATPAQLRAVAACSLVEEILLNVRRFRIN